MPPAHTNNFLPIILKSALFTGKWRTILVPFHSVIPTLSRFWLHNELKFTYILQGTSAVSVVGSLSFPLQNCGADFLHIFNLKSLNKMWTFWLSTFFTSYVASGRCVRTAWYEGPYSTKSFSPPQRFRNVLMQIMSCCWRCDELSDTIVCRNFTFSILLFSSCTILGVPTPSKNRQSLM